MDIATADIRWADGTRQRIWINLHNRTPLEIEDGDFDAIPDLALSVARAALVAEDHFLLTRVHSRRLASLLVAWRDQGDLPVEPAQIGSIEIEFRVPAKRLAA